MTDRKPTSEDVCECCIHFRAYQTKDKGGKIEDGECRRYPPVFTPVNQGDGPWIERFPKVFCHTWCGEFKPI